MTPERWQQIKDVLDQALDLKPEQRSAYLDRACGGDQELCREVESLLAAGEEGRSSLLQSSPIKQLVKGTRLGDYEVQSMIGAGGMGEVYRARDFQLRRDVAIKVLPAFVASNPERLRRFQQEAMAAAALNHPNILAVYQMGSFEGTPFLVSELLVGETLREQIKRGRIPTRGVIGYAVQIARGLAAAHEKGIVHRDLKPENLFITKDGRVKILDFGLAKLTQAQPGSEHSALTIGGETLPGVVMGTVGYMSPEQVRGESADHRADIFAFGAILYEMLTGQRAFQQPTPAETMTAILNEEPQYPLQETPAFPVALQRVVQHCLEKEPAGRFQSAPDLAFDLESLSGSSFQRVNAGSFRGSSSPKWKTAAAILCLLAAVALGAFVTTRFSSPAYPAWQRVTFAKGKISAARFAADGRTIVYSAAWNGRPFHLFATRTESPESRSLEVEDANLLAVSTRGEVAITERISIMGPDTLSGTLAKVPLEGGTPRELAPSVSYADWSPDGMKLAVVHQAEGRNVLEYPLGHVLVESGGSIAFPRISPAGDTIAYFEFPDPTLYAGRIVLANGDGNKRILSDNWTDLTGLAWAPNGKELWFTGSRTSNYSALFAVALDGRERPLLKEPIDLQLFDIARDGRALIATVNWRGEIHETSDANKSGRDLSWLDFSLLDDVSADGRLLIFHEAGDGGGAKFVSYLRTLDGSAPVKLTDGMCMGLSPNGQQVVCTFVEQPNPLVLVPTMAGTLRALPKDELTHLDAKWLADAQRLVFTATEPGHGVRLYVQGIDGGPPRPISPEGIFSDYPRPSPDGRWVGANLGIDKIFVFPVDGGKAIQVPGTKVGETVVGWSGDGRSIYVSTSGSPATISRVGVTSGKREILNALAPPDPSGVNLVAPIFASRDGKSYTFGIERKLCDLFVLTGLK